MPLPADALTLDQLRVLLAVVDEGSFSAAGRRLGRVQSAVSHAMASLEAQLGVSVWDRSTRVPRLTEPGRALVAAARRVVSQVDELRRLAAEMAGGVEARVALAVDSLFPAGALVEVCRAFAARFPGVCLELHTETMGAVGQLVRDGTCDLGVAGPAGTDGLERSHLAHVRMVTVVAPGHALAASTARVPTSELRAHVQIVLGERGPAPSAERAVLSSERWRVLELGTKVALLAAGLGWGNLPLHAAQSELAAGRLVRIEPAEWGDADYLVPLGLVWRPGSPRGPAARWIAAELAEASARRLAAGSGP
ncbi:MAG: LysR family transcriptional regulator [Polyangiaceae bacterium]|nr:LysR family transcriptional regulator [Polyangiaceae bacterium]